MTAEASMISVKRTTKRSDAARGHVNGAGRAVPALQNGDQLTKKEFHRRYLLMPEGIKAELIDGVVYMASPVSMTNHGQPHCDLAGWLTIYRAYTPGVLAGDNASLLELLGENEPQPDLCLRIAEESGGQTRIIKKGYIAGAPEWLGEISSSTVSIDLNKKFDVYEKNGVREYVVWRVDEQEIDWFVLKAGKFHRLTKSKDGLYKSKAFPGLWLDSAALIEGDLIKVLDVIQKGVASPEHQRFVADLAAKKK
jgi:hypothetical protein